MTGRSLALCEPVAWSVLRGGRSASPPHCPIPPHPQYQGGPRGNFRATLWFAQQRAMETSPGRTTATGALRRHPTQTQGSLAMGRFPWRRRHRVSRATWAVPGAAGSPTALHVDPNVVRLGCSALRGRLGRTEGSALGTGTFPPAGPFREDPPRSCGLRPRAPAGAAWRRHRLPRRIPPPGGCAGAGAFGGAG